MLSRTVRNGSTITNSSSYRPSAAIATGKPMLSSTGYRYDPPATGYTGAGLTFPSDLISADEARNFYISIGFVKYHRRSLFENGRVMFTDGIHLPIPNNLADLNAVVYSEEEMGVAAGLGVEASSAVGSAVGAFGALGAGMGGAAINKFLSAHTPDGAMKGTELALQQAGFALNPFLNVMFKAPTFKSHSFTWKLSPSNDKETETLRKIVAVVKKNMYPSLGGDTSAFSKFGISGTVTGSMVLSYPSLALIKLFPADQYLYEFKPCVITSMVVNFTPSGMPSFFNSTKAPTEVSITINFKEIEYWLSSDINPGF